LQPSFEIRLAQVASLSSRIIAFSAAKEMAQVTWRLGYTLRFDTDVKQTRRFACHYATAIARGKRLLRIRNARDNELASVA
jgi:hypothetical protein